MSKYVLVFLCLAANAFASSADSGRCPWHIPFTMILHATGVADTTEDNVPTHGAATHKHNTGSGTQDFSFNIDTASSSLWGVTKIVQYSLHSDTLRFYSYSYFKNDSGLNFSPQLISLVISFAPGKDSILSIHYEEYDTTTQGNFEDDNYYSFDVYSCAFNDSVVFMDHGISIVHTEAQLGEFWGKQFPEFGDFTHLTFTGYVTDLAGLFQVKNLARVNPATRSLNISITSMNNGLRCTFDASLQNRMLEIFSPIGIETGCYFIAAGQTDAFIPHLPHGFYFVRFDNSVSKAYVAE